MPIEDLMVDGSTKDTIDRQVDLLLALQSAQRSLPGSLSSSNSIRSWRPWVAFDWRSGILFQVWDKSERENAVNGGKRPKKVNLISVFIVPSLALTTCISCCTKSSKTIHLNQETSHAAWWTIVSSSFSPSSVLYIPKRSLYLSIHNKKQSFIKLLKLSEVLFLLALIPTTFLFLYSTSFLCLRVCCICSGMFFLVTWSSFKHVNSMNTHFQWLVYKSNKWVLGTCLLCIATIACMHPTTLWKSISWDPPLRNSNLLIYLKPIIDNAKPELHFHPNHQRLTFPIYLLIIPLHTASTPLQHDVCLIFLW